ncbi:nuclear pore complex assembly-domain-containing protein [Suillus paluster]|uniref:nuclear pore complex assembly-domain-containing protein n=1 Tax=Suillus paluster TaxID=48578 RepID=UPI001B85B87D|nr:nuclear pore complex assembly-domain-containing protein [Suillus paluster]KAG1748274.1 nuclear pore complex assembly-domain-containing protein [Suillus paluster]
MDIEDRNVVSSWLPLFGTAHEFPWTTTRSAEIESRRAQMADILIFDVLLIRGGIRQPDMLYPPTDLHSLHRLLDVINGSSYDSLKKDCLVYILLKWFQDGREATFAEERCIPPQFVSLADAYWHLDTGIHVEKAVSILSDARLNRDYASKIMQALSLSENPSPLIVKYVRTAKPPLVEPDDIDMYALALANSSLWDAWQFQRTFPDSSDTRSRLLHKLLEWCLSPKPRPGPLAQLVAFPLSSMEQSLLHAYALKPPHDLPSASIAIAQDLVCVRLVQSGDFAAAIKLDRQFSVAGSAGTEVVKAARERKKMMDDILANMTYVERTSLENELGQPSTLVPAPMPQLAKPAPPKPRAPLGDLSMSWEEIPSTSSLNGASPRRTDSLTPRLPEKHASLSGSGRLEPKSSLVGSVPGSLFSSSSSQKPPAASPFAQLPPRKPVSAPPVPLVGPSGITFAHSTALSKAMHASSAPTTSLFEKTGSAKQAPNAFYKPPPAPNGTSRALHTEEVATRPHTREEDDISMESDDDNAFITHEDGDVTTMPGDVDDAPELAFSVFGNKSAASPEHRTRAPASKQAETKKRAPPGAFYDEDEDESDVGSPRRNAFPQQRGARRSQPRAHSPSSRSKTVSSRKDNIKGPAPTQSIPGSLLDEEEEQDEDDVAPLPPSLTRKTRTGASTKAKPAKDEKTPARRSSRLSTTSSVASMSPEPLSPPVRTTKTRKSMRTSTASAGAASATRSSSRRKAVKS